MSRLTALCALLSCLIPLDGAADLLCAGTHQPARRAAKATLAAPDPIVQGPVKVLVVFAQFADEADRGEAIPTYAGDLFKADLPGSFTHFYSTMSWDQLQVQGTVLPKRYTALGESAAYRSATPGEIGQFGRFVEEILVQVDQDVDLAVFNLLGQRVITLHSGLVDSGRHRRRWDGRDAEGHPLGHGPVHLSPAMGQPGADAQTPHFALGLGIRGPSHSSAQFFESCFCGLYSSARLSSQPLRHPMHQLPQPPMHRILLHRLVPVLHHLEVGQSHRRCQQAQISVAMMLETSFAMDREARAVWAALEQVFAQGYATADLAGKGAGMQVLGTQAFGDKVVASLKMDR